MASEADDSRLGVYTKTVVRSPVILDILHAQIRSRWCNDVVFVGESFIQVKEVGRDGHLETVALKDDFDGRIRAATVLSNDDDGKEEDFLVKLEKERTGFDAADFPPQTVVLTLDSNDICFICLRADSYGSWHFIQQTVPMPCWDRILFQPGEYLAVDPYCRALAVAANEREVILYATKPKDEIQHEMRSCSDDWCPVSSQRPLPVDGIIHKMDFLMPPSHDNDHIILLLIVTDQRRTKAVRIEWYQSSGPQEARVHPGQSLESDKQVPSLLIPLPDSSFLLAMGNQVTRWRNILSGSASGTVFVVTPRLGSKLQGISSQAPIWTAWTRPRRNKGSKRLTDNIYLAREDGYIFWTNMSASGSLSSVLAADLPCHIGSAFASIAGADGPDILAVGGETSSGVVISIGQWPSIRRLEELSRSDTMDPETIEVLPNWASTTDLINMPHARPNHDHLLPTENVLVTSGRQPYGTITELRHGLELSLLIVTELEGLRSVTDFWTLPNPSDGSILAVLSQPTSTRLLSIPAAFDDDFEVIDATAASAFDQERRTLLSGVTTDGELVQVTEAGFCVTKSLSANFEDTWKEDMDDGTIVVAATMVPALSLLILAVSHDQSHNIYGYSLSSSESSHSRHRAFEASVTARPLALHAVAIEAQVLVASTIDGGEIFCFVWSGAIEAPLVRSKQLFPIATDSVSCDSLAILRKTTNIDSIPRALVACGLRDGRLVSFTIDLGADFEFSEQHEVRMGVTSTKLEPVPNDPASAVAMESTGTYMLTWNGLDVRTLHIENIWATDKQQPDFAQGPMSACSQIPAAAFLSSSAEAESLVFIDGDKLLVGRLDRSPTTIPRQVPVSGTPNRLIYADSIKSYVCASLFAEVRTLPSTKPHAPAEEKRQIWPVIDFVPRKGNRPALSYHMQPGERVHALLQWSYKPEGDKKYSFVLVGGSYIRQNGARRGRITFLQCSLKKNGEVAEAREVKKEVFEHDVHALALYDESTYVTCAGERVHLTRYEADDLRWSQVCAPFKLASEGIHATTEKDHSGGRVIVISTMRDSVVALKLDETQQSGSETRGALIPVVMGPRAETLISHFVLPPDSSPCAAHKFDQLMLMTSKFGQVIGMAVPNPSGSAAARHRVGNLVFDAQLSRSVTRMVLSPPAERKGQPPEGVVQERLRGTTTDGSIVGIALLRTNIWRKLSWLQRLIEWSPELSPHSYLMPKYTIAAGQHETKARSTALPRGLHDDDSIHQDIGTFYTVDQNALNEYHIDGDVLSRVLRKGGGDAVKDVLRTLAHTESWVAQHLDEELAAVDHFVEIVRKLDKWM